MNLLKKMTSHHSPLKFALTGITRTTRALWGPSKAEQTNTVIEQTSEYSPPLRTVTGQRVLPAAAVDSDAPMSLDVLSAPLQGSDPVPQSLEHMITHPVEEWLKTAEVQRACGPLAGFGVSPNIHTHSKDLI